MGVPGYCGSDRSDYRGASAGFMLCCLDARAFHRTPPR
jgi:hypothetical protein